MILQKIGFRGIRNLKEGELRFSPKFTLIHGSNGSGKSSILEALHLLFTGKSFRCAKAENYINFEKDSCIVLGTVKQSIDDIKKTNANSENHNSALVHSDIENTTCSTRAPTFRLKFERSKKSGLLLEINQNPCASILELTQVLPISLVNIETYRFFEGLSKTRRQFLDWGMFHVEHGFYPVWQKFSRVLKQRNAALKRVKWEGIEPVRAWNKEFFLYGEALHAYRLAFLESFLPVCKAFFEKHLGFQDIDIKYKSGWKIGMDLNLALEQSLELDILRGFSSQGPHRGDIQCYFGKQSVETVLSRGQLKLFLSVLWIARSEWLYQKKGQSSLFLLDDLKSELDHHSCSWLLSQLTAMNAQVVLTAIEKEDFEEILQDADCAMFHVEHGTLTSHSAEQCMSVVEDAR